MGVENILHWNGIRLRVTGTGNLKATMYSFDEVRSSILKSIPLESVNSREPTRLANFVSQRMKLRVEVTEINESFRINRIIVFNKPLYTQFPG